MWVIEGSRGPLKGSPHPGRCPEGWWRQYFSLPNPGCACQEKTFGGIDVMRNYIDGVCDILMESVMCAYMACA